MSHRPRLLSSTRRAYPGRRPADQRSAGFAWAPRDDYGFSATWIFTARGPLGLDSTSNSTASPSATDSKRVLRRPERWKKISCPSDVRINPNPRSLNTRLIVPVGMRHLLWLVGVGRHGWDRGRPPTTTPCQCFQASRIAALFTHDDTPLQRMLRRLSTYTAQVSPRAHAVAGKDAEAHEGLVVLVTFIDGAVLDTAAFQLC